MRYVVLSFVLYLISIRGAFDEPLTGDETGQAIVAERLADGTTALGESNGHPPLYSLTLASWYKVFGATPRVARSLNVVCFAALLLLTYLLAIRTYGHDQAKAKRVAGISILALAVYPAAVWPSLLVDIDTSILAPLGLVVLLLLVDDDYTPRRLPWLVLGCTLLLSAKLQSGPLVAIGHGLYLLARRRHRDLGVVAVVWTLAIGLTVAVTWIFARTAYPHDPVGVFLEPFIHGVRTVRSHGPVSRLSTPTAYRDLVGLVFWLNPFLLMILAAACIEALKRFTRTRNLTRSDLLLCVLLPGLGVPTLVIGLHYGMPKYHFPFVPVLLVATVGHVVDRVRGSVSRAAWLLTVAAALYYLVPGDVVLYLGYELKRAIVHDSARAGLLSAAWRVILYAIPLPVLFLLLRHRTASPHPWLASAAILAVGSSLGPLVIEALAPYQKVGLYGARDTRQAADAIWAACREGLHGYVLHEFFYEVQRRDRRVGASCLTIMWPPDLASADVLVGALERVEPDFLVTGLPINSLHQLRDVFPDPRVRVYLEERYDRRPLGDFTMWSRAPGRSGKTFSPP